MGYQEELEKFRKENPEFVEFEKGQRRSNRNYYAKHIHVGSDPSQVIVKAYKDLA